MIHYSVDTEPRLKVYLCLAVVAIGTALGIARLFDRYSPDMDIFAPTAFSLFPVLILLYDRVLWNLGPFKYLSAIPDLSGEWTGTTTRKDKDAAETVPLPVTVHITQSWTRIDIILDASRDGTTTSMLVVAGFNAANPKFKHLKYMYTVKTVEPSDSIARDAWDGCCELRIMGELKERVLRGRYVTDYPSQGTIELRPAGVQAQPQITNG